MANGIDGLVHFWTPGVFIGWSAWCCNMTTTNSMEQFGEVVTCLWCLARRKR